ncbi:MAG: acyltransferase family protein [Candidatus Lernaella stagnicola]|nr:acyltransferase family protein [Candidatus Lernaella stagnicola]
MSKTAVRYHEIDMLKGLACVLMLVGHAMRSRMPVPHTFDKIVLHFMDFSGPIFFFVSGMNVMTFLERNADKPGFRATRFYLAAAAVLFVLGFTYNLNRASPVMDIFQGVAVCTVVVYLLMRLRMPTFVHWLIVIGFYAVYLLTLRLPVEIAPRFAEFRELRAQVPLASDLFVSGISPALAALFAAIRPLQRWTMIHFGFLQWITFFYVGALCYRSVTRPKPRTWPWWALFGVLFVVGPFLGWGVFGRGQNLLDAIFLDTFLDLMLRGIPSYVAMTLGGAGLLYLVSRRHYPGASEYQNPVLRFLADRSEMLGKESFMFLIVHWWLISTVLAVEHALPLNPYLRSALVIAGTVFFVPVFARLRDRLAAKSSFATKTAVFMIAGLMLTFLSLGIIGGLVRGFGPSPYYIEIPLYVSYLVSFGFAFVYPTLRLKLRRRYTTALPAGEA